MVQGPMTTNRNPEPGTVALGTCRADAASVVDPQPDPQAGERPAPADRGTIAGPRPPQVHPKMP